MSWHFSHHPARTESSGPRFAVVEPVTNTLGIQVRFDSNPLRQADVSSSDHQVMADRLPTDFFEEQVDLSMETVNNLGPAQEECLHEPLQLDSIANIDQLLKQSEQYVEFCHSKLQQPELVLI